MDAAEIIVITVGVAGIIFVLWYFFGERERVAINAVETSPTRQANSSSPAE